MSIPPAEKKQGSEVTDVLLAASLQDQTGAANRLPSLGNALFYGTEIHGKLIWRIDHLGEAPVPASVTGRESGTGKALADGHGHLHIIPIPKASVDSAARPASVDIGHFLLHADQGLGEETLAAVQTRFSLVVRKAPGERLLLTPVFHGNAASLKSRLPLLYSSNVWTSATPFIPPCYLKASGKSSLAFQIRSELSHRGFPTPSSIEIDMEGGWQRIDTEDGSKMFWTVWRSLRPTIHPRAEKSLTEAREALARPERLATRWSGFVLERNKIRKPCVPCSFGIRIHFDSMVDGPMVLGYGSHFGMGVFLPKTIDDPTIHK